MSTTLDRETIERKVRELGPWFHNLDLGGVRTAPDHFLGDFPAFKWRGFAHAVPADLTGKTVLDIGCNAGFYAMEMRRRGAAHVVGIDADEHCVRQARFAAEVNGLDHIEYRQLSVYDVGALGEKFDLVLFLGVLYHLRHPLLALDLIHEHVAGDLLIFQGLTRGDDTVAPLADDYEFADDAVFSEPGAPRMQFIEKKFAHDETNWWVPNRACTEAMLRSAGFTVQERADGDEVYVCRRAELPDAPDLPFAVYPARAPQKKREAAA